MSDKFWNFSKAERIAAIALSILMVLVLTISFFVNTKQEVSTKDYSSEIEEFKSRIISTEDTVKSVKKKTRRRTKKIYTPNTQNLTPVQKESR